MTDSRVIFKSATSAPLSARDALAMVLSEELLLPSETVYLMAPWISDVVVFDNSTGAYDGLNTEWGRREVTLIDVLLAMTQKQTRLVIRVRPDKHNDSFGRRLLDVLKDAATTELCHYSSHPTLHTKGLVTDRVVLSGSMNFTYNGIFLKDESLAISFDLSAVAQAHITFAEADHD